MFQLSESYPQIVLISSIPLIMVVLSVIWNT